MVQNSVQNVAGPPLQLRKPHETFDTSLSITCETKLNKLHMKWLHIVTGSFRINGRTLFWRFCGEKNKMKDILSWGREEMCL